MRLTTESYAEFARDFAAGKHGTQRLGQAFCNTFAHGNAFDAVNLFYLEDASKAQDAINQILADYQL